MFQPDGLKVCNYAVVVTPGGEDSPADDMHRRLTQDVDSMIDYGIMERWESSGVDDAQPLILQEKADQIVEAYGKLPEYVTVVPVAERQQGIAGAGEPYRWMDDFEVGDRIQAACRQGYLEKHVDARVMRVTVSDKGHATPVRTAIDLAPTIKSPMSE